MKRDEGEKICPVGSCGTIGVGGFRPTNLGEHPFIVSDPTVVKDETLSGLIKKLLNEGEEDEDGEEEILVPNLEPSGLLIEDLGPLKRIQAKQPPSCSLKDVNDLLLASQEPEPQEEEMEYMTVAVFTVEDQQSMFDIEYNYFYIPSCLTVRQFRCYLEDRFRLHGLQLFCDNQQISHGPFEEMSLIEVCDEFWFPYSEFPDDIFTLRYCHDPHQEMNTSL